MTVSLLLDTYIFYLVVIVIRGAIEVRDVDILYCCIGKYHARIQKQEEYNDCFAGSDGSD